MRDACDDIGTHPVACFQSLGRVALLLQARVQLDRALPLSQELARQHAEPPLALDRVGDEPDRERDEYETHRREVDSPADRLGKYLRPIRDDCNRKRNEDQGDERRHPEMLALTLDVLERRCRTRHLRRNRTLFCDHPSITTP